jgi:hypothetical protein
MHIRFAVGRGCQPVGSRGGFPGLHRGPDPGRLPGDRGRLDPAWGCTDCRGNAARTIGQFRGRWAPGEPMSATGSKRKVAVERPLPRGGRSNPVYPDAGYCPSPQGYKDRISAEIPKGSTQTSLLHGGSDSVINSLEKPLLLASIAPVPVQRPNSMSSPVEAFEDFLPETVAVAGALR